MPGRRSSLTLFAELSAGCPAPEATDIAEVEKILGAALRDFASELRLIDARDLAAFIRLGQIANLRSLVQSSAELFFRPGSLDLAELGDVQLDWFRPPLVTLPMTFKNRGVRIYFRLRLAALTAGVEIESVTVGEDEDGNFQDMIERALHRARIPGRHSA
jgi:hypothetical protein